MVINNKHGIGSLQAETAQTLQALIETTIAPRDPDNPIYGAVLHVEGPCPNFSWSAAAGTTDHTDETQLTPQHPMRLASVSKTYVAAAILRLWEDKHIELNTAISEYLSSEHRQCLSVGGYQADHINVRHLLTHTSGLFDYADSDTFAEETASDFARRWCRTEQLQLAMDEGSPYGQPGEVYRYSDTGYILLGEIIELITDQPLGAALRQLLNYSRLGLTSTWMESSEPAPEGVKLRAHQYLGKVDTNTLDPSFDIYGGGGLVSTVEEVARFFRALFTGDVFVQPDTQNTLLSTANAQHGGPAAYGYYKQTPGVYRMGIEVEDIDGLSIYAHGGFWGTYAGYVPSLDVAISFSLTQHNTKDEKKALFREVLKCVRNTLQASSTL